MHPETQRTATILLAPVSLLRLRPLARVLSTLPGVCGTPGEETGGKTPCTALLKYWTEALEMFSLSWLPTGPIFKSFRFHNGTHSSTIDDVYITPRQADCIEVNIMLIGLEGNKAYCTLNMFNNRDCQSHFHISAAEIIFRKAVNWT